MIIRYLTILCWKSAFKLFLLVFSLVYKALISKTYQSFILSLKKAECQFADTPIGGTARTKPQKLS